MEKSIYSLQYIPIKSVCQKRKPQIDGSFLNVLHIQGQENNYCCQWLVILCILGWLLQATRGNHVCLPQVSGQKPKLQIDNIYKVRNLHIQGEENLSHYLMHYHQKEFSSQHVLVTGNFNLHFYGVANENKFIFICIHLHMDLSHISDLICQNIHVDLLSSLCVFVTSVIQSCPHVHMDL